MAWDFLTKVPFTLGTSLLGSFLTAKDTERAREANIDLLHGIGNAYRGMGSGSEFLPSFTFEGRTMEGPKNPLYALGQYYQGMVPQLKEDAAVAGEMQGIHDKYALGQLDTLARNTRAEQGFLQGRVLNEFDRSMNPVLQGYQDRYNRGMGYLANYGDQARRDLSQQYTNVGAAAQQQMAARGLAGTSAAGTAQLGVAREEADARARLNESINTQMLNTDAALSGDVLSVQGQNATNRFNTFAGLQGQFYGENQALNEALMNSRIGASANQLAINLSGRDRLTALKSGVGQSAVDITNAAANNWINALAGTTMAYPDASTQLNINQSLGAGAGYAELQKDLYNQSNKTFMQKLGIGGGMAAGAGIATAGGLALPMFGLPALTATGLGMTALGGAAVGGLGGMAFGAPR